MKPTRIALTLDVYLFVSVVQEELAQLDQALSSSSGSAAGTNQVQLAARLIQGRDLTKTGLQALQTYLVSRRWGLLGTLGVVCTACAQSDNSWDLLRAGQHDGGRG